MEVLIGLLFFASCILGFAAGCYIGYQRGQRAADSFPTTLTFDADKGTVEFDKPLPPGCRFHVSHRYKDACGPRGMVGPSPKE
jgi:hypothetical protein